MRPGTASARKEGLPNSLVGSSGVGRGFRWSSAEGAHWVWNETNLTEKEGKAPTEGMGLGSSISRLGCQCWHCVNYGRSVALCTSSPVPKEGCLVPQEALQEEQIISPLCITGIFFQIAVSMPSTFMLFASLLFRSNTVLSGLFHSQVWWLAKLQALGIWCRRWLSWSSWGRSGFTGTEGGLTKKGCHNRVQVCGTWCKQARQPVSGLPLTGSSLVMLRGAGREWCLPSPLSLQGVFMKATFQWCPSRANNLLLCIPIALQITVAMLSPPALPACLTSRWEQCSALRALPSQAHQPLNLQS